MLTPLHPSDGSDDRGRDLEITIRIGIDGRVYLYDITADLVPVVLALNPDDPALRRRLALAADIPSEKDP